MSVASFVNGGIEDDNRKLADLGIGATSEDATKHYIRWIRQDLIGIQFLIYRLILIQVCLGAAIAIPLWMLALR